MRKLEKFASALASVLMAGLVMLPIVGCCDDGVSAPDPGPIIDIVVGPDGHVTYKKDNSDVTYENSSYEIDPDFMLRITLGQFLNRNQSRAFTWKNNNYVAAVFDDGGTFKVTLKGNSLEFKCTPAGDTEHTITAGADSSAGIPDCMKGTLDPPEFSYTESGVSVSGDWLHLETAI